MGGQDRLAECLMAHPVKHPTFSAQQGPATLALFCLSRQLAKNEMEIL